MISFEINWDERINFGNVGIIREEIFYHCHNSSKYTAFSLPQILSDDEEEEEEDDEEEEEGEKRTEGGITLVVRGGAAG